VAPCAESVSPASGLAVLLPPALRLAGSASGPLREEQQRRECPLRFYSCLKAAEHFVCLSSDGERRGTASNPASSALRGDPVRAPKRTGRRSTQRVIRGAGGGCCLPDALAAT
jgi:hypothetical protein